MKKPLRVRLQLKRTIVQVLQQAGLTAAVGGRNITQDDQCSNSCTCSNSCHPCVA